GRDGRLSAAPCEMADVGGNDEPPPGDLLADEFPGDVLAQPHAGHLRSDRAPPGRLELCHRASLRRNDPDQVRGVGRSPCLLSRRLERPPRRLPGRDWARGGEVSREGWGGELAR